MSPFALASTFRIVPIKRCAFSGVAKGVVSMITAFSVLSSASVTNSEAFQSREKLNSKPAVAANFLKVVGYTVGARKTPGSELYEFVSLETYSPSTKKDTADDKSC